MSKIIQRRGFLRGLTTLPLVGGSVSMIGSPTRADVPITRDLLENYATWLDMERRWLAWERCGDDKSQFDMLYRTIWLECPVGSFHPDSGQPSARAAMVLSAVGCPLYSEEGLTDATRL